MGVTSDPPAQVAVNLRNAFSHLIDPADVNWADKAVAADSGWQFAPVRARVDIQCCGFAFQRSHSLVFLIT